MKINGQHYQSIWYDQENDTVSIIDQTRLPHAFITVPLQDLDAACLAIRAMQVRGAPLIGVTAAYGVYLALRQDPQSLDIAQKRLAATRPTAVNLRWALQRMVNNLTPLDAAARPQAALALAREIEQEDIATCAAIGEQGAVVLRALWQQKADRRQPLQVLTHCNAGALATVDWGTALSVVYKTAALGIPVHVWVDETRPRNQGASLTCWELGQQGIGHTLIVDNAGGYLMQQGKIDVCVVGSDRTTVNGDVCNKIGTYLKALAAHDNGIPFYAALPVSTIDFSMTDGLREIPIEERAAEEVSQISGINAAGELQSVRVAPPGVAISNFGFDVTPARLVSGIITEHGVHAATSAALSPLAKFNGDANS